MATTEQELESFAEYARERLDKGDVDLSIDELFDLWRAENPSDSARAENVAAVQEGIRAVDEGRMKALDDFSRDFRERHDMPKDG